MKINYLFIIYILFFLISGCGSSSFVYTPPAHIIEIENNIIVNDIKDNVWKKIIQNIGKNYFVINTIDKESGFINISYSGNPELYTYGGELHHHLSVTKKEHDYIFPASRANVKYSTKINGSICRITRTLSLEGRMNIVVNDIEPQKTLITVYTKYILTLNLSGYDESGDPLIPFTETISFNTGQSAINKEGAVFYANGEFEKTVLALVK